MLPLPAALTQSCRLAASRERATQPEGQRLVIVALSAHVLDCHVAECRDAGFDGHLGKPLRADSIEQLRRYISASAS